MVSSDPLGSRPICRMSLRFGSRSSPPSSRRYAFLTPIECQRLFDQYALLHPAPLSFVSSFVRDVWHDLRLNLSRSPRPGCRLRVQVSLAVPRPARSCSRDVRLVRSRCRRDPRCLRAWRRACGCRGTTPAVSRPRQQREYAIMCQEHRELAAVAVAAGQAAPGQSAASVSASRGVTGPYWFVRLGDDKNCA